MSTSIITPHEAFNLGWSIIPANRNKTPMLQVWKPYQNQIPTKDEFEAWMKWNPPAWAIVTGSVSGRITLDFDGQAGRETFEKLQIPAHRSTPSSGFHADFAHPGWRISSLNGKSKIELGKRWPGMDIRGDGGYVLFHGSTEKGKYVWLRDSAPHPFSLLPEELQQFLKSDLNEELTQLAKDRIDTERLLRMALERIDSHGRNNSGFWLAAQLRDNQFSQSQAYDTLEAFRFLCPRINRKGEEEEYTEAETRASIDQAYARPARVPLIMPKKETPPVNESEEEKRTEEPTTTKHFKLVGNSIYHVDEERGSEVFVSSKLDVLAYARDANSESWGRLLSWEDPDGKKHTWVVTMGMLAGDGAAVREVLANGGLDISNAPKTNHFLAQYIRTAPVKRFIYCVPHTGWFDRERAFVFPESVTPKDKNVAYQTQSRGEHFYRSMGTLESWQKEISEKCIGNSRLVFAVSTALAGPLLRPLNIQGGGFHFRSASSKGKSTTQWLAGSVWGGGGRNGFARTWAATKNAIESIAELHNDGCLILDEIRMIDPREVEQVVYMLANGSGKARENKTMTGRRTLQWLLMVLSSGEITLGDCAALAGHGPKIKGGAEIRMATIPADAGARMGIFEVLHDTDDPRIFAETLEAAAKQNYGTAIYPFLEHLIAHWNEEIQSAREWIEEFIKDNLPKNKEAAAEIRRVLRRFAVVACAGEMASEAGITNWESGEASRAAAKCFRDWIKEQGGLEGADLRNATNQIRGILQTQRARFYAADPEPRLLKGETEARIILERIPKSLGYWKIIDEELVYLVETEAFKNELCEGYPHMDIADHLYSRKLMLRNDGRWPDGRDRPYYKAEVTAPEGGRTRPCFFAIKATILED